MPVYSQLLNNNMTQYKTQVFFKEISYIFAGIQRVFNALCSRKINAVQGSIEYEAFHDDLYSLRIIKPCLRASGERVLRNGRKIAKKFYIL